MAVFNNFLPFFVKYGSRGHSATKGLYLIAFFLAKRELDFMCRNQALFLQLFVSLNSLIFDEKNRVFCSCIISSLCSLFFLSF